MRRKQYCCSAGSSSDCSDWREREDTSLKGLGDQIDKKHFDKIWQILGLNKNAGAFWIFYGLLWFYIKIKVFSSSLCSVRLALDLASVFSWASTCKGGDHGVRGGIELEGVIEQPGGTNHWATLHTDTICASSGCGCWYSVIITFVQVGSWKQYLTDCFPGQRASRLLWKVAGSHWGAFIGLRPPIFAESLTPGI